MLKRKLKIESLLLTCALLSWGSGAGAAEPVRYVSDQLIITLRAGQGDQYKILRTLVSGTRLEVLEEEGEFSKVRAPSGEEGWVRNQYLVDAPTAKLVLQEVSDKLARYEQENKRMREQLGQLKGERDTFQQQTEKLDRENRRLTEEHARISEIAQRPMELDKENRQLKQQTDSMGNELKMLRSENSELKASSVQKWFMAGAGVLLLGVVAGLILPKLRGRKESMWR